jgi:hypothetical protein
VRSFLPGSLDDLLFLELILKVGRECNPLIGGIEFCKLSFLGRPQSFGVGCLRFVQASPSIWLVRGRLLFLWCRGILISANYKVPVCA